MNCFIQDKDGTLDFSNYLDSTMVCTSNITHFHFAIKSDVMAARAYTVFEFIRNKSYKIIYFVNCSYLSFYCLESKLSNMAFLETDLVEVSDGTIENFNSPEQQYLYNKATLAFDSRIKLEQLPARYSQTTGEIRIRKPVARETISVCISHKNRWNLLTQALNSLETQSYKNFDVILIDDFSDDETRFLLLQAEAAKKFHFKLTCYRNSASMGPGYSRNKAANLSTAKYVLFMDDDNIAKPEELEYFLQAAESRSADIVTCCFDNFKQSGLNDIPYTEFGQRNIFLGGSVETAQNYNCVGDTNSFFRRESFLKAGGFFEDATAANEDWELMLRMTQDGFNIVTIPFSLFYYRWHHSQRSSSASTLGGIHFGQGITDPFY